MEYELDYKYLGDFFFPNTHLFCLIFTGFRPNLDYQLLWLTFQTSSWLLPW